MTDITELAQRNELLIANGQQTADLLRHLADNEIDSDYFAVVSECESYGKETDAELSITEFAIRAAGYVDALVEALEKAQQRIDELESRTVKLPQRHITQFRKGFDDYYNEMVYKADEVLVSLADAGIEVRAEKIRIVLQELKEDGVLTTYSNGHVEMLPYRIDENGEEYVEMFPNDIELH